jgi:hypothetical protein
MGIDASIALSGKPIDIPNPLNQMAAMYQMQGAQNQNALAKYQLSSAQRSDEQANMLNRAYSSSVNPDGTIDYGRLNAALATGNAGSLIPAANKQRFEAQKAQTEAQKTEGEVVDQRLKQSRSLLDGVTTPEQYIAWHEANHKDPVLGKYLADRGVTAAQSRAKIAEAVAKGPEAFAQLLNESKLGAEKAMEQHFLEQGSGQQKWTSAVPKYGTGVPAKIIPGTIVNQVAGPEAMLRDKREGIGQSMTDARARELAAITREGNQTQIVVDPIRGPILVNKQTGIAKNAVDASGKPMQGEVPAKKEQSAKNTLSLLDEADKIIGTATGSYIGAGVDQIGRAFGGATPGDKASSRLKVLEGSLMLNQPRMEGPQSDKDVMIYKQMAGQIGDSTVPTSIKKAALETIRALNEKYAGVPSTSGVPSDIEALLNKHGGKK